MKPVFVISFYLVFTGTCCFGQCPNLIINGDFSNGNIGFSSQYSYCNASNCLVPAGEYTVGNDIKYFHNGAAGNMYDHTLGTTSGSYFMANGADVANTSVWCQTIAVKPNTAYQFSTWVLNWSSVGANLAILQFSINGIQLGDTFTVPSANFIWEQFFQSWYSGSETSVDICILALSTAADGNDLGLDDISFSSCECVTVSPGSDVSICYGSKTSLTATSEQGLNYSWSPTQSINYTVANPEVSPKASTQYTLVVSEGACADTGFVNVQVFSNPTAYFLFEPTTPIVLESIQFTDVSQKNILLWSWDFGDDSSSTPNPKYEFSSSGLYAVKLFVIDNNGCFDSIVKEILVIEPELFYIPNSFSPNGDGLNDVFYSKTSEKFLQDYRLIIFNKWGELLFETHDISASWNGKYKGTLLKEDIYVYKIEYSPYRDSHKQFVGHVNLIK